MSVSIDRSIDAGADSFTVDYGAHDRTPPGAANPLSFDGDESVELRLDGELMLTGYLDSASIDIDSKAASVSLAGNSRTIDLYQCPVVPGDRRFVDQSILAICESLCAPFGIEVEVDPAAAASAATVLETFKAEFGEDVAEAIARAARFQGLLVSSSAAGNLRLARLSTDRVATLLKLPGNIQQIQLTRDARERFSTYYVLSRDASRFDPDDTGDDGKVAEVVDKGVARYRPFILESETHVKKQAQRVAQAEWERNRRAGQSFVATVRLPGWKHSGGIWAPNTLVRLQVERQGLSVDEDMVVTSVGFRRDAESSEVQLELTLPAALEPEKIPLPRRSKKAAQATYPEGDEPGLYGPDDPFADPAIGWVDADMLPRFDD